MKTVDVHFYIAQRILDMYGISKKWYDYDCGIKSISNYSKPQKQIMNFLYFDEDSEF